MTDETKDTAANEELVASKQRWKELQQAAKADLLRRGEISLVAGMGSNDTYEMSELVAMEFWVALTSGVRRHYTRANTPDSPMFVDGEPLQAPGDDA